MKQTARKGNKGLPKATIGRKGHGSGSDSGGGGGSGGNGNRNGGNGDRTGNIPGSLFRQQMEHRLPPAVPKQRKLYVGAFRQMKILQLTMNLCISKYQMAR